MAKYLGEVDVTDNYAFLKEELALKYIFDYGQVDGAHHKAWVLDQVVRILNDCPYTVHEAQWDNGLTELRIRVGENEQYLNWVRDYCEADGDPDAYEYDPGVAP